MQTTVFGRLGCRLVERIKQVIIFTIDKEEPGCEKDFETLSNVSSGMFYVV
jgi:hypothetical protein